jgi:hypothetical protein
MKIQALLITAVLVVSGCGGGMPASKQTTAPSSTFTTVDTGPSPEPIITPTNLPTPTETAPPDDPSVARVGATEWFTYENGLKVQVTKLTRFKLGDGFTAGKKGDPGVKVTVTVKNGSKQTVDLSSTTVNLSYGTDGAQAEQTYDITSSADGFPGSVTPGRTKTATFMYVVPAGKQAIAVEVEPGFLDYEACHFEGSISS